MTHMTHHEGAGPTHDTPTPSPTAPPTAPRAQTMLAVGSYATRCKARYTTNMLQRFRSDATRRDTMLTFKPTNAFLKMTAESIERNAKESLPAWCLLGMYDRYAKEMAQVRKLRHAMTLRGLRVRAEYLSDL